MHNKSNRNTQQFYQTFSPNKSTTKDLRSTMVDATTGDKINLESHVKRLCRNDKTSSSLRKSYGFQSGSLKTL